MTAKFNSIKKVSFKVNNIKEDMARLMFNRSFTLAQDSKQCIICGEQSNIFSCDRAEREFKISATCESCQNEVFEPLDG